MKIAKYAAIFIAFLFAAFGGLIFLSPSNVEFTVNKDVKGSVDEVFAVATNYNAMDEWLPGLEKVSQTKGREVELGSKYDLTYGVGEEPMVMTHSITQFQKDSAYAFTGVVKDFMRTTSHFTFQQIDSNTTRIRNKVNVEALSYKMRLFMNNEDSFKKNAAKNLEELEKQVAAN